MSRAQEEGVVARDCLGAVLADPQGAGLGTCPTASLDTEVAHIGTPPRKKGPNFRINAMATRRAP